VSENLVIVESPAKAKTIEKFLGDGFLVLSSYGHIRDLPRKNAIDIENDFATTYEVTDDKKKVIADLRKAVKKADMVWLASDEDREGEAIAWHLEEVLGLNEENSKRIVFHEITKPAIMHAIENPRTIDRNLVNGQQARRVLDRLIGFELSPVLWKKIQTGLSAGRVQSVAVRFIVEREREIDAFTSVSSFRISAEFDAGKGAILAARLPKDKKSLDEAVGFLESVASASFTIADITNKPAKRSPRAPFTTSTLQQEASQKLGFSVRQTMVVAQRLYESGKITYMRTDSVNLSKLAVAQAIEEIGLKFGENYVHARVYKSKSAGAQEAHEAIRPTDFSVEKVTGERNEQRLYQLIWQRALASQMADAKFERTTATVDISTVDENMQAKGEVLIFDGFLKAYGDNDESKMLPPLQTGQDLPRLLMQAQEVFSRPPARFTEASLVKKLEEMGIGRPSTYAPTISTIQNRGYVNKDEREGVERQVRVRALEGTTVINEDRTEITGAEKEIQLFEGSTIQILDGRWGPFITDGFKNAKIPKDRDPGSLKLDECEAILAETTKLKKRIGQQFYSGGFVLIKNPSGRPDATIKVADNKQAKAAELAAELESEGKKIRLISARGAKAIRAAEMRGSSASKKKSVKKKAVKKKAKKKKSVKKKAVKKKAVKKKA